MDLDIDGDAALVTASSRGLGKASARALVREGVDVAINGRSSDRLDNATAELREEADGATVLPVRGDLIDPEDVTTVVEETVDAFGGLDHLVTSAGGPPSGPFLETDDEDWYAAFDQLVMSVVRTIRAAEPHLRSGGGTIVTIASRTVKEAAENMVLSNSVRMSVLGLEKTLSNELAPEIRVNAVLPGSHETVRVENLVDQAVERGDFESRETAVRDRVAEVPLQRLGTTEEFGAVVAFLSSPRSAYVNGVAIPVDGGSLHSTL